MYENTLLLTGHRKCGTTMFHNLFDGHSNLDCYPVDLSLLYAYYPHFISLNNSRDVLIDRLDKVIFQNLFEKCKKHDIDLSRINKFRELFFSKAESIDLCNIEQVLKIFTDSWTKGSLISDLKYFVLKETSVDIYARDLFKWFENLKIIHLIRDPRDNFAAIKAGVESYYKKIGEGDEESLASLIHRAQIDMKMASINSKRYGPEKYLVLKFEDLVTHTEKTMRQVCNFLDINFEPKLLQPTFMNKETGGNNFEQNKMYQVDNRNINSWDQRIRKDEAKVIEFFFKDLMFEFGYELAFNEYEHADAEAEFYKWMNYKYFYSDSFSQKV